MVFRCVLAFLTLISWSCFAQPGSVFLDQYTVDDGLTQSEVSCILKDSRGYVWMGTQNGLNRFDGHQFTHYRHQPFQSRSLSHDYILSLCEDRQHQLWIGTRQGLNRFDPSTGTFVRYGGTDKYSKLVVNAICQDKQGFLWIGTHNGLLRISPQITPDADFQYVFQSANYQLKGLVVHTLLTDPAGTIWAGTSQGLVRISVSAPGKLSVAPWPGISGNVYCLVRDGHQQLWLGTDSGLYLLDGSGKARLMLTTPSPVTALLASHRQTLWVSVLNEGIHRFDLATRGELFPLSSWTESADSHKGLKSAVVSCIYEGSSPDEDVVWIGTRDAGVQVFSYAKNSFKRWESELAGSGSSSSRLIFSICTDRKNHLWVGTYQGLFCIDRRTRKTDHFKESIVGERVVALLEDHQGTLWAGSESGLFRRNGGAFERVSLGTGHGYISKLYEDRRHQLWIGTGHALFKRAPDGTLTRYEFTGKGPGMAVEAIEEDRDGTIWVGTLGGLYNINNQGHITSLYTRTEDPTSLLSNEIYDIHIDRFRQIWIASSKGLSLLHKENGKFRFEHFTEEQGLSNNVVYGMLEDSQGRLWMSTNMGISRFDPRSRTFRNYSSSDGLSGNEFNSGAFHQSSDGEFFFGGIGTLVSFRPYEMAENRYMPPVVVTSFRKFERSYPIDSLLTAQGRIELRYNENFFSFVFNALDYTNPQKNQYAYQLEGFQDDWNFSGTRRYVSFSNLSPGDYVLKIKAANSEGIWNNDHILEIPIRIIPPFWQRWWFYGLCLLAAGMIARLFYTYRVRKQVAHLLELEKVKLAENERVRKLAAQDLHDEFGNTITRISMLTEIIKTRLNGNPDEILPLLTKISDNANRMYQGTKDFIWAINPDHDNLYEIAIRLKDFGDDVLDKTGIRFEVVGLDASLRSFVLPMGASRHLIFLFKEAISNTLKHAGADTTRLEFTVDGDTARVIWTDDGKGFSNGRRFAGNGLLNMENRARKINGNVQIESHETKGTWVVLEMKVPPK